MEERERREWTTETEEEKEERSLREKRAKDKHSVVHHRDRGRTRLSEGLAG